MHKHIKLIIFFYFTYIIPAMHIQNLLNTFEKYDHSLKSKTLTITTYQIYKNVLPAQSYFIQIHTQKEGGRKPQNSVGHQRCMQHLKLLGWRKAGNLNSLEMRKSENHNSFSWITNFCYYIENITNLHTETDLMEFKRVFYFFENFVMLEFQHQ